MSGRKVPDEKKVILILGQRGSGKSYLAKRMLNDFDRYLIYDTLGEYREGIIFDNLDDLKKFWLSVCEKKFRMIYQPLNPAQDFEAVCELVFASGQMTFLVEEVDNFCSPMAMSDELANIIQRGRHKDITFIGVSQRPFGINRLISSQAKEIYSFIHKEPRDIDYLKSFIGDEAGQIENLKQYQYLHWSAGKGVSIEQEGKAGILRLPEVSAQAEKT